MPDLGAKPTAWALAAALGNEWPSYLAFVTSFGTIIIVRVNHHTIVKLGRRADTLFVFANGFHLLHVTVVPFITVLVARYLTKSFLAGFPIYLVAMALAFWKAYVSIALCFCLWVVWAITGYERLPEDGESPPAEDPRQPSD